MKDAQVLLISMCYSISDAQPFIVVQRSNGNSELYRVSVNQHMRWHSMIVNSDKFLLTGTDFSSETYFFHYEVRRKHNHGTS